MSKLEFEKLKPEYSVPFAWGVLRVTPAAHYAYEFPRKQSPELPSRRLSRLPSIEAWLIAPGELPEDSTAIRDAHCRSEEPLIDGFYSKSKHSLRVAAGSGEAVSLAKLWHKDFDAITMQEKLIYELGDMAMVASESWYKDRLDRSFANKVVAASIGMTTLAGACGFAVENSHAGEPILVATAIAGAGIGLAYTTQHSKILFHRERINNEAELKSIRLGNMMSESMHRHYDIS